MFKQFLITLVILPFLFTLSGCASNHVQCDDQNSYISKVVTVSEANESSSL